MAGISIKDAPLVEDVKEDIKIPVSDGSNSARAILLKQVWSFITKGLSKVAISGSYKDLKDKPDVGDIITEETIADWGFTKNKGTYIKPESGIPYADLEQRVQKSLNKADSALQKHQDISHLATQDEVNDGLALKQDAIEDLEQIRQNASKGATAIQVIPSEYITETKLQEKDYATNEKLNNKVDKVEGKQLSTEDFTTLLRQKLEGLSNYDDSEIVATFNQLRTEFDALVGGNASAAINSFNEIIAFLEGIEDSQKLDSIIASIEQQIAAKGTYSKPNGGIPKSDLASAVQTSLGKADTALQSYTEQYKGTVTGVKINGTTKNPANGVVDLGTVITQHQDISNKADKNKYNNYSTDEVRIGTWINGKPIYRKTLVYTCDDLTKTKFWAYYPADTTGTEISQLNIDAYTNMSGVTFCANQAVATGAWQPIPRVCPDANEAYNIGFGDLKPTRVGVLFGNKYLSATVYLTIEYTKTTD